MKKNFAFTIRQINVRVDILLLFMLLIMYLAGYIARFITAYACIIFHEMGHVLAACIIGKKVYSIRIMPFGLNAVIEEDTFNKRGQLLVYLSGPFANILLIIMSLLVSSCWLHESENMYFFISINAYLAGFNLMPVLPLDGGRILKGILSAKAGIILGSKYARRISLGASISMLMLGVLQLYISRYNFSLLLIGIFIFFTLKSEGLEAALMNVKSIIYRRSRLMKKGIYQARDLVVLRTVSLSEIIKSMDFDRFHIVYVLDENLKLLKVYTEQEVIDAMFKFNADLTFQELIQKQTGEE